MHIDCCQFRGIPYASRCTSGETMLALSSSNICSSCKITCIALSKKYKRRETSRNACAYVEWKDAASCAESNAFVHNFPWIHTEAKIDCRQKIMLEIIMLELSCRLLKWEVTLDSSTMEPEDVIQMSSSMRILMYKLPILFWRFRGSKERKSISLHFPFTECQEFTGTPERFGFPSFKTVVGKESQDLNRHNNAYHS